jgi:hypothetical protein
MTQVTAKGGNTTIDPANDPAKSVLCLRVI